MVEEEYVEEEEEKEEGRGEGGVKYIESNPIPPVFICSGSLALW